MPASFRYLTDARFRLSSLLAKWRDGQYYTAAVVKCNKEQKKCLVCFEDGSEHWLQSRDIHIQLSYDNMDLEEDLVCSICDDGKSEPMNEIVLCDVCQQGYHQKCHIPVVDDSTLDESDSDKHQDWMCSTCYYILNQSRSPASTSSANLKPTTSGTLSGAATSMKRNTSINNNNYSSDNSKETARERKSTATNNNNLVSSKASNNHDIGGSASRLPATDSRAKEVASLSKTSPDKPHGRTKPKNQTAPTPPAPPKVPIVTPVKHAVRKSAINHLVPHQVSPIDQQASPRDTSQGGSSPGQAHGQPQPQPQQQNNAATLTTTEPKTSPTNRNNATKSKSISAIADNLRIVSKKPKLVKTPPQPLPTHASMDMNKAPSTGTLVVVPGTASVSTSTVSISTSSNNSTSTSTSNNNTSNMVVSSHANRPEDSRLHLVPATGQAQHTNNNNTNNQTSPILNQNKQQHQQQLVPDHHQASVEGPPASVGNVVDQLIPRPENFEGDNNPFVDLR